MLILVRGIVRPSRPAAAIAAGLSRAVSRPFTVSTTIFTSAPASAATLNASSTGRYSNSYIAARSAKRRSTACPMKPSSASSSPRESQR